MDIKELHISWSRLSTWEYCHQKSFLISSHKNPARDARNTLTGNICDRAQKEWLNQEDPEPGWMVNNVERLLSVICKESIENEDGIVRFRNASDRTEIANLSKSILKDLEGILLERVIPFDYDVAMRFKTPIKVPYLDDTSVSINLIGEIDLIVRRDDRFQVWDLKATKDNSYWKKSLGQLMFYDIATLAMFNEKTSCVGFIQPACKEQILTFDISDDDRRQTMSRIIRYAHGLWRGDNFPKEEKLYDCSMCAVTHACERFKSRVDSKGKRRISLVR